jgi:regulatory protein
VGRRATLDPDGADGRRTRQKADRQAGRRSTAAGSGGEPEADPVAVAREICLRLLTERARTRQELAQALRKRDVPDEAAATVLERFDEVGLIDDAAFAGQWVRSRHAQRGLARRAIAVELRRKGVADEVAQEALAEVDTAAEEQRARELVDRKLRSMPADTPERLVTASRKLVGMLARRGYPGGIAYRVVREALAAVGAEQDELGEPDL